MSQTSYSRSFDGAFSGQLGDTGPKRSGTYINDHGFDIPAGVFVAFKAETSQAKTCKLPASAADQIAGVSINSYARDPDNLSGAAAIKNGNACNVLEEGAVYVAVEQTMVFSDPVYARITSDGVSNTQLGKVRKDSDSGRAILVPGARVLFGGSTSQPALVYFSASVEKALESDDSGELQVTLSAAAEAANSITVTGAVVDRRGQAVASAKEVLIRTLAVTADKGDLSTGGTGTVKKTVNPATGENVQWMTTTAAGAFSFAVANDQVEDTFVQVSLDNGRNAVLKLTFT